MVEMDRITTVVPEKVDRTCMICGERSNETVMKRFGITSHNGMNLITFSACRYCLNAMGQELIRE